MVLFIDSLIDLDCDSEDASDRWYGVGNDHDQRGRRDGVLMSAKGAKGTSQFLSFFLSLFPFLLFSFSSWIIYYSFSGSQAERNSNASDIWSTAGAAKPLIMSAAHSSHPTSNDINLL